MNELTKASIIRLVQGPNPLTASESFDVAQWCSVRISSDEAVARADAREIVIRILESWNKLAASTIDAWLSLVEAAGLYPYLAAMNVEQLAIPASMALGVELHKSDHLENTYLHEEQIEVVNGLLEGKSIVLSAPTSFGKSLLIEEIVAARKFRNIVIIQPTLALLDETRKKLRKYSSSYHLVVSTSQAPSENFGNIFLFTGERVVEYKQWPQVDFFIIDEFYKLSLARDDERAVALNQALHRLLKMTQHFYLLGPSVDSVSASFSEQVAFEFKRTNFATVALDDIHLHKGEDISSEKKIAALFDLLHGLKGEPTLVYCSSPAKAADLTTAYITWLSEKNLLTDATRHKDSLALAQWVQKHVHPNWSLANAVHHRIGYHHGSLPRHVGSSIVDLFNKGELRTLLCTSTLIEGVNTAAKNVVLFDNYKGNRKAIDFFDYRNIAGRSGRMFKYFTGRLFRFEPSPNQFELSVDIPLFSQVNAPPELLVQLDENEVKPEYRDRLDRIKDIDGKLLSIIKDNGLSIDGQLAIVRELFERPEHYHPLLAWRSFPRWEQILAVCELGWKYLLQKGESKGNAAGPRQLALITRYYISMKSFAPIIERGIQSPFWNSKKPDDDERREAVISSVLGIARHWFDYKLPKWLGTISSLQDYVFTGLGMESGDYMFLATQLEHGFLQPNLAILLEYDVPASALRQLARFVPHDLDHEGVMRLLRRLDVSSLFKDEYERRKLSEALM